MQRKTKGHMQNVRVPCGSRKSEIKINLFPKIFFILTQGYVYCFFLEGEKHQCERETLIGCLLYAPDKVSNQQLRHVP